MKNILNVVKAMVYMVITIPLTIVAMVLDVIMYYTVVPKKDKRREIIPSFTIMVFAYNGAICYIKGGSGVILYSPLLLLYKKEVRRAILTHELGHRWLHGRRLINKRDNKIRYSYSNGKLDDCYSVVKLMEFQADLFAARFVGADRVANALETLLGSRYYTIISKLGYNDYRFEYDRIERLRKKAKGKDPEAVVDMEKVYEVLSKWGLK